MKGEQNKSLWKEKKNVMDMKEQEARLLEKIENQKDEMLEGICKIVSIDSKQSEPAEHAPYGLGPRKALDEALKLAKSFGFETEVVADQVGIAKYGKGDDSDYIGVLGHVDVVPEGTGWTSPAYEPEVRDGRLYGRGVLDNKGPLLSCLYALKAMKDLGIKTKHPIWILFGTNEETGMEDVPTYLKYKKPPVAGWTPDCKYPVVYAERGRSVYEVEFANPEDIYTWVNTFFINNMNTERAFKLDVVDPEFGRLEIRNRKIEAGKASFAVSYPPCIQNSEIEKRIQDTLKPEDKVTCKADWKPVFFEKDSTLCKVLQSAYEEITGLDGTPVTTTGGTYAKRMPNIVPFGPSFPGQKGIAHLPDEWMNLDDLMSNAKIYGLSLLRLGNAEL